MLLESGILADGGPRGVYGGRPMFPLGLLCMLKPCMSVADMRTFNWEGWYIVVLVIALLSGALGRPPEELGDTLLLIEDGGRLALGLLIGERDGLI